jgi:transcriptional regulator
MERQQFVQYAAENTSLTEHQAEAYYLREEGITAEGVAELMGCSESAVYNAKREADKKIDEALNLVRLTAEN